MKYLITSLLLYCFSPLLTAQNPTAHLLNHNGYATIEALSKSEVPDHELYALAWHMVGDRELAIAHTKKAIQAAKNGREKSLMQAALLFEQEHWQKAVEAYQKAKPESPTQLIRYYTALNESAEASVNIASEISSQKLSEHPAFTLILADYHARSDDPASAKKLLQPLVESDMPLIKIEANLRLADITLNQNKLAEGYSLAAKASTQSKAIVHDFGLARSLDLMAFSQARQGKFEEAKKLATQGAAAARRIHNISVEYRLNNLLAWFNFETNAPFDVVLQNEARLIQMAKVLNHPQKTAGSHNNLGYDLTVAGTVSLDSLIAITKIANDTYGELEGHSGRWYTLMNLVWQYRLKGDLEQSIVYAKLSLDRAMAIKDRHAIIEAAFQYGETLMAQGKMQEAAKYYEIGLKQRGEEADRDAFVFDVYHANYLWKTGAQDEAISMLYKAVDFLSRSEVFYEMHGRALLASFLFEKGSFKAAKEQINVIRSPRNDYVAFESRCIAARTLSQLLTKEGEADTAKALRQSYLAQAQRIGAKQLATLLGK